MNIAATFAKPLIGGTVAALLLAGCSAQQANVPPAAPGSLQERAQSVMQLAKDKDYAGALAEIDSLTDDVRDAGASGELPRQQWLQAEAALAQLRTDLGTLTGGVSPASADNTSSAPVPSATPSPSSAPEDECDGDPDQDHGSGTDNPAGTADDDEDLQEWQEEHDDWNDRTSADAGNSSDSDDDEWLAEEEWRDD
ncbi:hypothetical protein [Arthrobacter sp. USHLN218]|uniref:hypothetical protein n=1 Tax=Arthrobacter sp. USHLN218 TaxID=3081232 RepID=UPI0030167EFA